MPVKKYKELQNATPILVPVAVELKTRKKNVSGCTPFRQVRIFSILCVLTKLVVFIAL